MFYGLRQAWPEWQTAQSSTQRKSINLCMLNYSCGEVSAKLVRILLNFLRLVSFHGFVNRKHINYVLSNKGDSLPQE